MTSVSVDLSRQGTTQLGSWPIDDEWFLELAQQTLQEIGVANAELSAVLCDDGFILPLNRNYRGKDKPTDVLSFPLLELTIPENLPSNIGPEGAPPLLLGDVIISLETASNQAHSRGHSLQHEVAILLVHGVFHLLGHDHEEDDEAAAMEARETEVFNRLRAKGAVGD